MRASCRSTSGAIDELSSLADRERFDLTVVGPELPLDLGVVDRFRARGHRIFGPSRAAAQLECSKSFAKAFMTRHGIPTARFRVCDSAADAHQVIARGELGLPIVIKADGLAAGKGVVVAADRAEADAAIRVAMEDRQFGQAGARVVHRGVPERARRCRSSRCATAGRRFRSARRRITSACSTTTVGRTPAGWGRSRRAR